MTILKLHEPSGEEIFIHCERVAYFKVKRPDGNRRNTLSEIYFSNGESVLVKESIEGLKTTLKNCTIMLHHPTSSHS